MDRVEIVAPVLLGEDIFTGSTSNSGRNKICLAFRGLLHKVARVDLRSKFRLYL